MEPSISIVDCPHGTADDGLAGDLNPGPECDTISPTSVQPMPHNHDDRHDTDFDLESANGEGDDTISTHSSETETVFSQNNESDVTGPTGSAPSSKGRKGDEKESITVSSFDGSFTVDLKGTSDTPRRRVPSQLTIDHMAGDERVGPTSNPFGGFIITPSMNSSSNWEGISRNAPAFQDAPASGAVPASVHEEISRFVADVDSEDMPPPSGSGLSGKMVATQTDIGAAISAVVKDGGSLNYTVIYQEARLNMFSSHKMDEIEKALSPRNLRQICSFSQNCPSSFVDYLHRPGFHVESQYNKLPLPIDKIVNYLLEMITQRLDGAAPKIKCSVRRSPAAETAALRFGFDKTIVLHSLESCKVITFVCCDETFPSQQWAEYAVEAFLEGAEPWTEAGLKFKQVDRKMPAHFRIAFSLFPMDLDCSVLAQAFFPGATEPEERTLWVYLLAFHGRYYPHMAGYMGHEAGHIGGSRHGFDEHILPDGSEIPELKSVTMGPDNPSSVMNYHDNPADFAVQPSDICDMRDMHSYAGNEYEEYRVLKVEPQAEIYASMLSFEFVIRSLLSNATWKR